MRANPSAALAALAPPRQHYQWYYSTAGANEDMHHPAMGLHAFLRAYYHVKSADGAANQASRAPRPLRDASAASLATLPAYYVMPLGAGMPAAVAPEAPSAGEVGQCRWLPDAELDVYTTEYARLGFQGGLHWYRCTTDAGEMAELQMFDGIRIEVPACYIAGAADWGIYQAPGAFERMQRQACRDWRGAHLVPGAGHWVQQEQPEATAGLLRGFLAAVAARPRA